MRYWRIIFFLVGALVFLAVIRQIALADFTAFVRTLDWRYAVLAFVSYMGVNVARVERMTLLIQGKISRRDLFSFVFLQNFLNVFFSFSGDAAYVSLVHRTKGVPMSENVASFISAKALDLIVLAGIFFAAVFASASPLLGPFRLPAAVLFICVAGVGGFVMARPVAVARGVTSMARTFGIAHGRMARRVLAFISEAARGFSLLDRKDVFARVCVWTLINWACTFLVGWFLLYGVHITLGAGDVLFAYTFPIAAALTPFYVFGGFGSYEVSFLSGLVLVGIDTLEASRVAVAIHMEELIFLVVCAAAGLGLQRGYLLRPWKKTN